MNLLSALRRLLRRAPPPSKLRNRPGGMAYIRFARDEGDGSYVMHGRVVMTVRTDSDSFWVIDPPQEFTVLVPMLASSGRIAMPGDPAVVESMHDDLLEPMRHVGDGERDESAAWLPQLIVEEKIRQGVTP